MDPGGHGVVRVLDCSNYLSKSYCRRNILYGEMSHSFAVGMDSDLSSSTGDVLGHCPAHQTEVDGASSTKRKCRISFHVDFDRCQWSSIEAAKENKRTSSGWQAA